MSLTDDYALFREMYLKHRVYGLGGTREQAIPDFRKVCYAFMQDANWKDSASLVHPHRLAEIHHRGEVSEVERPAVNP